MSKDLSLALGTLQCKTKAHPPTWDHVGSRALVHDGVRPQAGIALTAVAPIILTMEICIIDSKAIDEQLRLSLLAREEPLLLPWNPLLLAQLQQVFNLKLNPGTQFFALG